MSNNLSWFIGLRYVRSRKEEGFFSLVSIFSFAAMALGVAALIIVLSVMNGFDKEIKQRILNVIPHIIFTYDSPRGDWQGDVAALAQIRGVRDASPYVDGEGMLSAHGRLEGVSVQGVDPASAGIFALVGENMLSGSIDALQGGEYGVILGSLLARSLNVVSGDEVLLTLPQMTLTPMGAFPRVKRLRVVGVYQVGAQVDAGIALVHVNDARKLFRLGDNYEGLRVSVADPFAMGSVLDALDQTLAGKGMVRSWHDEMKTLFAAIKMEKTVVGLLLAIVIAVAGFNIVASLVLMVASKRKDIAVLRAMGATSATITGIFRVQGAVAGLSGVFIGVAGGCLIAWQLGAIVAGIEQLAGVTLFDPNIYFISQLPSDLRWRDVLIIASFGVFISFIATLYPAYRAGQVSPSEVLRYEH